MTPPKRDSDPITLTLGSTYHIRSIGSRETMIESRGIFKGIVSVGTADGIALELGDTHGDVAGKIRLIPSHMVLAVDILEQVPREEENREEANIHYT